MEKIEQKFKEVEESFLKNQVSNVQVELIIKLDKIIDTLDTGKNKDGFLSWDGDRLISASEKLSRYSETIGEFIYYHESRSDFAYIWRKGSYASDWLPEKERLNKDLGKATTNDIDSVLTKRYIEEQYYSMFHRRRADYLDRKMGTITKMIKIIDHRLWELQRQRDLPQGNQ